MLKNRKAIIEWLDKYNIENYTINTDLTIDVQGYVNLSDKNLKEIPVKFNKIDGDFDCSENQLMSLEFCPKIINGIFDCSHNQLISLEYCPKKINGDFYCSFNQLVTLKFCPQESNGDFDCSYNNLISLRYSPKEIKGYFDCYQNNLENLFFLPKIIIGSYFCNNNKLVSLNCANNKISKKSLYSFNSSINNDIINDFGNKEEFLSIVKEQKILYEKNMINKNLENKENSHLAKKRL